MPDQRNPENNLFDRINAYKALLEPELSKIIAEARALSIKPALPLDGKITVSSRSPDPKYHDKLYGKVSALNLNIEDYGDLLALERDLLDPLNPLHTVSVQDKSRAGRRSMDSFGINIPYDLNGAEYLPHSLNALKESLLEPVNAYSHAIVVDGKPPTEAGKKIVALFKTVTALQEKMKDVDKKKVYSELVADLIKSRKGLDDTAKDWTAELENAPASNQKTTRIR